MAFSTYINIDADAGELYQTTSAGSSVVKIKQ